MVEQLDRPILSANDDRLGRGPFVTQVADALVDKQTKRASGLVVSLLGAWGSGKSSILNMLEQDIRSRYEHAIVLRFDPWLITNRDSLIRQFLSDLGKVLAKDDGLSKKASKKVGELLSTYDEVINAGVDLAGLFVPSLVQKIMMAGKAAVKKTDRTLHELKREITVEIEKITYPIVVLIDEVDRLEDAEVLEIMRLVKAVADFPNVSYLIAYDVDRVVEALGAGAIDARQARNRGRAYLEKIVQHQVFLPALFESELVQMFRQEVIEVIGAFSFPPHRHSDDRYNEIENAIFPSLIKTPRDLKRCIGVFRALHLMVSAEVDWVDLLGYAVMLAKAPTLSERIKNDPIFYSSDFARGGTAYLRYGVKPPEPAQQLIATLGTDFAEHPEAKLLHALFPRFAGRQDRSPSDDRSRIEYYRALTFLLRQGTPPGSLPLGDVRSVFSLAADEIKTYLDSTVETGQFPDLGYILNFHYRNFQSCDHVKFWTAVADWCRKPDSSVPKAHDPRVGYLELAQEAFRSAATRTPELAQRALEIVRATADVGAVEFAARILRDQIWAHGLFTREQRADSHPIGESIEWERACADFASRWKEEHLTTDWFFGNWKESPVWVISDNRQWDARCKMKLNQMTDERHAFAALVMMLFGRHYSVDRPSIEMLIGWENFAEKFSRLESEVDDLVYSDDIRAAVQKVSDRLKRGEI